MQPVPMARDEFDAVVHLIAQEQVRPERNISFIGVDAPGIASELLDLDPPWTDTARVVHTPDGGVAGVVGVDLGAAIGRAWIYGPWVAGDDVAWNLHAPALLDAALAQVPPSYNDAEIGGEVANERLERLARERGWKRSLVHHVLRTDAVAPPSRGTEIREAHVEDVAGIRPIHDLEFPNTHASADALLEQMIVLVAVSPAGDVTGYAAGRVQPDGEGYIEYIAVSPEARGRGIGRDLLIVLTERLLEASPQRVVALTVADDRTVARTLYASLGFTHLTSFVAYRSN